jgi:hypothetical protein
MPMTDEERVAMRREAYELKDALIMLQTRLAKVDPIASAAVGQARSSMFEAWTILCVPPEDDDHEH